FDKFTTFFFFFQAEDGIRDRNVTGVQTCALPILGWSIDSEDWKSLTPEKIKQNILNYVHPGAIILMHSAGHWSQDLSGTAEALDQIIPYLKKKGYEFVTVPELWS